jgi:SAM-dependent methyltransferase
LRDGNNSGLGRAYENIDEAWVRLRQFLGNEFDGALIDYGACCLHSETEFRRLGDHFYTRSKAYLYELTHFHFMPCKDDFFLPLIRFARGHDLRRLADLGCGVGLDAQMLMRQGFSVDCFDFPSPCTEYLAWRFTRDVGPVRIREFFAPVSFRFDLSYAMDVLEHTPDPVSFARYMFRTARYVCFNLFPHDRGERALHDMHYPLDHWKLLPILREFGTLLEVGISGATIVTIWQSHL